VTSQRRLSRSRCVRATPPPAAQMDPAVGKGRRGCGLVQWARRTGPGASGPVRRSGAWRTGLPPGMRWDHGDPADARRRRSTRADTLPTPSMGLSTGIPAASALLARPARHIRFLMSSCWLLAAAGRPIPSLDRNRSRHGRDVRGASARTHTGCPDRCQVYGKTLLTRRNPINGRRPCPGISEFAHLRGDAARA